MTEDRLIIVSRNDLLAVLDYAQPDEEADIIENPESDTEHHVVYPMRRLREQADSDDYWPVAT